MPTPAENTLENLGVVNWASIDVTSPQFGADPTGMNYSDTAFAEAIAAALAVYEVAGAPVQISGPAGVYKLGQYVSLAIPTNVFFGGFGGGAPG